MHVNRCTVVVIDLAKTFRETWSALGLHCSKRYYCKWSFFSDPVTCMCTCTYVILSMIRGPFPQKPDCELDVSADRAKSIVHTCTWEHACVQCLPVILRNRAAANGHGGSPSCLCQRVVALVAGGYTGARTVRCTRQ